MQFADVVRSRKMTRSFASTTVEPSVIDECVSLASRAPSAGKTQGWSLLVLEGSDTQLYWDVAFPASRRESFAFPELFRAPVIALSMTDPTAYLDRYSESDKEHTGLGKSLATWPAPYWTIDASFATMTFLLALEDHGLGALFFAHANEAGLRQAFGIPGHIEVLGTIACGYPNAESSVTGRSASRRRSDVNEIIHRSQW
jgi:nitroreductase